MMQTKDKGRNIKENGFGVGKRSGVGTVQGKKKVLAAVVKRTSPDLKAQPGTGTTWQAKWIGKLIGMDKMRKNNLLVVANLNVYVRDLK